VVRTLELPILSRDDTARLVALDLDRLMPFPSGSAVHSILVTERDPQRNRQTLRLAAALRSQVLAAVDRAEAFGLSPVALLAADSDLDLLPALKLNAGLGARRLYWGVVVAALIGVNLFLLIYRDLDETARLRSLVEEQRPAASAGLRLQRTSTGEQTARRELLARRQASSPMSLLATLDEAVPGGAWVHRLAWNGSALRLTGYRSASVDMLAALRADPRFSQVRGVTEGPQPAAQPGGRPPFDVSAVVRTEP
jgi:PAS domain-containing protein